MICVSLDKKNFVVNTMTRLGKYIDVSSDNSVLTEIMLDEFFSYPTLWEVANMYSKYFYPAFHEYIYDDGRKPFTTSGKLSNTMKTFRHE